MQTESPKVILSQLVTVSLVPYPWLYPFLIILCFMGTKSLLLCNLIAYLHQRPTDTHTCSNSHQFGVPQVSTTKSASISKLARTAKPNSTLPSTTLLLVAFTLPIMEGRRAKILV